MTGKTAGYSGIEVIPKAFYLMVSKTAAKVVTLVRFGLYHPNVVVHAGKERTHSALQQLSATLLSSSYVNISPRREHFLKI